MRVRVAYSPEYRWVRDRLDSLAVRALEEVEAGIAADPELGLHRRQIGEWFYDLHGLQGDLIVRYRRLSPEAIEFSEVRDMRNPRLIAPGS
jgi:hypothetical protein